MPSRPDTRTRLLRHFRRSPIADLTALKRVLSTSSRTTVFRALSDLGYRTSCSHAGRYYTLKDVPHFDEDGLWVHEGALFSRHDTLRATVVHLVHVAPAGCTHAELQARLRLRVQDTLRGLARAGEIGRTKLERVFLYLAVDQTTAAAQLARRVDWVEAPQPLGPPGPAVVVEVLVEIIHDAKARGDPTQIVQQLAARQVSVTASQVEEILREHGVKKKARHSRSRRSRH